MALRVKISARAAVQIRRAADWWVHSRPAAPGAVAKDVGESIALLAEQPGIGAKYEGGAHDRRETAFPQSYRLLPLLPRRERNA
jgi:plasmid stabilization system protein ParE